MTRIYFAAVVGGPLLLAAPAARAAALERGNLIFDNVPEAAAGSSEKLDAYLSARQATPLGFSPKGQLLIATRFGDVDQLHLVDHPGGERRQITFLPEPITQGAFSPDPEPQRLRVPQGSGRQRERPDSITSAWASPPQAR